MAFVVWGLKMFPEKFCGGSMLGNILKLKRIKCVQVAPGFERFRYPHDNSFQITRGIIHTLGSAPANNSAQPPQFACIRKPLQQKNLRTPRKHLDKAGKKDRKMKKKSARPLNMIRTAIVQKYPNCSCGPLAFRAIITPWSFGITADLNLHYWDRGFVVGVEQVWYR